MIKEHDRIVLLADLPSAALKAGDVGTVVHIYPDRRAYEVEFVALDGTTAAVETVDASTVREVRANEMTHSRPLHAA